MMNRIRGFVLIICGLALMVMLIMLSGIDGQVSSGDVTGVLLGGAGLWAATFMAGAIYTFVPLPLSQAWVRIGRAVIVSGFLICLGFMGADAFRMPGMIISGLQAAIVISMYFRLPRLG